MILFMGCAHQPAQKAENINPGVPWPATDALGRQLPMNAEVGPPRRDRFVGIFYFINLGRLGDRGPFDVSKILARDPSAINNPASPLWGPIGAPHYWGQSIFGYYVSEDESVLRKNAQMLSDAGVDTIIFDVSNQANYPESWQPLCRVYEQIRREGGRTPQIAFLCPFWNPGKVVHDLWHELYGKGLYSNLWFRWKGKPLILADPALAGARVMGTFKTPAQLSPSHTLGESFVMMQPFCSVGMAVPTYHSTMSGMTLTLFRDGPTGKRVLSRRFTNISDGSFITLNLPKALPPGRYFLQASSPHGAIGWWGDSAHQVPSGQAFADGKPVAGERVLSFETLDDRKILNSFTFRKPQPDYFTGPTGPDQWGWLEVYPQHVFKNAAGAKEEMTVGVAQNAVDGKLSVLSNPRSHGRNFHNGVEPPPAQRDFSGQNFAEQWRRALQVDPEFIFITGWNEWIAGRFDHTAPFYASGPVTFVDEFNEEGSRDIEPMQGGHGDDYYYQMIANIRRFKGVPAIAPVHSRPITIDGRFKDWAKVKPEFSDTPGDPVHRSSRGWGKGSWYENQTGRNDIIAAKVSLDKTNVYFYVRTSATLTPPTDANWMLLFIDADHNPKTGWLGYDFIVNRANNVRNGTTTIERNLGGYHWGEPQTIPCRMNANQLELAIPRSLLGLTHLPATLDFKWADNIQQTGQASDFTLNGDAAPNDRFNFRAQFQNAGSP
jgi:hypothetical protein